MVIICHIYKLTLCWWYQLPWTLSPLLLCTSDPVLPSVATITCLYIFLDSGLTRTEHISQLSTKLSDKFSHYGTIIVSNIYLLYPTPRAAYKYTAQFLEEPGVWNQKWFTDHIKQSYMLLSTGFHLRKARFKDCNRSPVWKSHERCQCAPLQL